jgi:hypothetical protein
VSGSGTCRHDSGAGGSCVDKLKSLSKAGFWKRLDLWLPRREPLAPLWVGRLCRANHCRCTGYGLIRAGSTC